MWTTRMECLYARFEIWVLALNPDPCLQKLFFHNGCCIETWSTLCDTSGSWKKVGIRCQTTHVRKRARQSYKTICALIFHFSKRVRWPHKMFSLLLFAARRFDRSRRDSLKKVEEFHRRRVVTVSNASIHPPTIDFRLLRLPIKRN